MRYALSIVGKPASRSSSFTIAERKKSFEALTNRQSDVSGIRRGAMPIESRLSSSHQLHASQDSLASIRTGSTSLIQSAGLKSYSCVSSRRSSRDEANSSQSSSLTLMQAGSSSSSSNISSTKRSSSSTITPKTEQVTSPKSSVTTVSKSSNVTTDKSIRESKISSGRKESNKEISSTDSTSKTMMSSAPSPKDVDDNKKWSTLEKKWSYTTDKSGNKTSVIQSGDARNKIAQFAINNEKSNTTDVAKLAERPRDLSFSSTFSGQAKVKMSPGSGSITPCAKNIREITEKWEERSTSVDPNSITTPTNSSLATTPTHTLPFARRSTQDALLTPSLNTIFQHGMTTSQVIFHFPLTSLPDYF